ncbi:MAG: T9SS type A sorting domain-containing protein, partial [Bacteroidota bacterium]
FSLIGAPSFPATVPVATNLKIKVQFAPLSGGTRETLLNIWNNDSDEKNYDVKLEGEAIFTSGIELQTLSSSVKIYPNPAGDVATIDMILEKQGNISIRVFDVQGKETAPVIKTNFSKGLQRIDLNTSNLKDGVYYVEVLSETSASQIKIVVMH